MAEKRNSNDEKKISINDDYIELLSSVKQTDEYEDVYSYSSGDEDEYEDDDFKCDEVCLTVWLEE